MKLLIYPFMSSFFDVCRGFFLIKELRLRLKRTFFLLLLFRIGSCVELPGVDLANVSHNVKGILGLLDSFLGGSFSRASIFALGVAPYISASIIMQLLSLVWPKVQRIQRDGEMGRRKITYITRLLTVGISVVQSLQYLFFTTAYRNITVDRAWFLFFSAAILTTGTIFCMWLGERISEKGIGNGVTMLIMIGIVSSFPGAIYQELVHRGSKGMLLFIFELLVLFFILASIVAFTQATRKVPIQYVRQLSSSTVYGGERQYIPIKLNNAGVMPIIFAQLLIFGLSFFIGIWGNKFEFFAHVSYKLQDVTSLLFNVLFALLIVVFTYFYTSMVMNPVKIADDMKRSNSFVPGVTSGRETAYFFEKLLKRITLSGALFLVFVSTFPAFASHLGLSTQFAKFYGGTSLLIIVSSILEIIQQIESYFLIFRYEMIISSGRRTR